jgi:hypothetical protein
MNCEHTPNMTSEERKSSMKLSKSRQMKEEFEQFVENINSASRTIQSAFSALKENLSLKAQIFIDLDQLASAFEALARKASGKNCMSWTESETSYLISIIGHYCNFSGKSYQGLTESDWKSLEKIFPTKTAIKLQNRWNKILADSLPANKKSTKTCNIRFIGKGTESSWSSEEEVKLMTAFIGFGKQWKKIAQRLGNRTESEVRNHLKTILKRLVAQGSGLNTNMSQSDEVVISQLAREFVEKTTGKSCVADSEATTTTTESVCEEDIPRIPLNYASNGLYYVPNAYSKSMHNQWIIPSFYVQPMVPSVQTCGNFSVQSQPSGVQEMNTTTHLFKIASGSNAKEEFCKEATKSDSKIFFAMVNVQNQQIQLIEKVSQATFPKYF